MSNDSSQTETKNLQILGGESDFLNPYEIINRLDIHPGMRIADFGCGSGHLVMLLAQKIGDSGLVSAIDILESALDAVQAKAIASGIKNVHTIRGNFEVIGGSGLPDGSHDLVIIVNSLFQNDDKVTVIKEAKRVLRQNGALLVVEWSKDTDSTLGPPFNLRTDKATMQSLITQVDFTFDREINAGKYHYGLLFRKV